MNIDKPKVVFEDRHILVVDKPSGLVVTDANTVKNPTIQSLLRKNFDYQLAKSDEFRSGIVHRLDKETSGLLIVAKNLDIYENLQEQFKKRIVEKKYLCLVHGRLKLNSGIINAPVGRLPWNRERFGILPGGRVAVTHYKLLKPYKKDKDVYCLVEAKPKTGRTHQIRIHMKHLGHPIVSDLFYAGRKTSRKDRLWCPRIFLHASMIKFIYPDNNEHLCFESKLPDDLSDALLRLRPMTFTASISRV